MRPEQLIATIPGYDPYRDAKGYEFRPDIAERYIQFCETYLTHIEGKVSGRPYILEDHERAIYYNLFGWYHIKSGKRRYREALLYVPRKNSKSTFAAGLVNTVMFVDDEARMQCYSCGADRDQASIVRNIATAQVQHCPELQKRVKVYHTTRAIELLADGSIYRALSADAHTKHGLNAHFVVCDEIHAYPNSELIDVMKTSMGARQNPLIVYTTTADFVRESACNQILDYAIKVRDGVISDAGFLPVIYSITKEQLDANPECWKDPEYWAMANPMLGKSVTVDFLERECKRAIDDPSYENTFKRLYLNIQTETSERMISSERWNACGGEIDIEGREVVGVGLDIGSTSDMCSLCLLFDKPDRDGVDAKWWHWIPRAKADELERKHQIPFAMWERSGFVELNDGNMIDYAYVERRILEIGYEYPMPDMHVDRLFQGAQLCQRLEEQGQPLTAFACSFYNMTAPTAEFLRLVNSGKFGHGDNPVMRWQASNAILSRNAQDNIKPGKAASDGKIDGIVSAVMALAMAITARENTTSVYETRGALDFADD